MGRFQEWVGKIRGGRGDNVVIAPFVWAGAVWATFVAGVLIWQAVEYQGVFAWIAELQFRHFDRLFPVATVVSITALLSLPFIVIVAYRLRRRRQLLGRPKQDERLRRERKIRLLLAVPAGISAVLAVVLFFLALSIGGFSEKAVTTISLSSEEEPPNGMAITRGWLMMNRKGFYTEKGLFGERELMVVPLVQDAETNRVRYFVEISPFEDQQAQFRTVEGLLRKKALPGGLGTLYENSGYVIERPTHILYRSRASARWPLLSAAGNLAFFAFLLGLGLALHHWHVRSMKRQPVKKPVRRPEGFFNQ
ncbi:hypothetical protein FHS61_000579 [Altererythrobacter atlanticus]|nr:hypothetical protein [Croceibacterium atlanticum]MBB5731586.1 hypothetical protein [Croceibacterium atlanticum]